MKVKDIEIQKDQSSLHLFLVDKRIPTKLSGIIFHTISFKKQIFEDLINNDHSYKFSLPFNYAAMVIAKLIRWNAYKNRTGFNCPMWWTKVHKNVFSEWVHVTRNKKSKQCFFKVTFLEVKQ